MMGTANSAGAMGSNENNEPISNTKQYGQPFNYEAKSLSRERL